MRITLFALFLFAAAALGQARDQEFAFALPEQEGKISLGVYDGKGQLVRTLFVGASESDFKVGLNGLITTWDGKSDAGKALPAGKYNVRGFVVGPEVKADGEAYHFNDWIESDDSPAISGLGAVIPAQDGQFFLQGFLPGKDGESRAESMVWKFEESAGLTVVTGLPARSDFLTGEAARFAVDDTATRMILVYNLPESRDPVQAKEGPSAGAAFWKDSLYVLSREDAAKNILVLDAKTLSRQGAGLALPAKLAGLDANAAALLGWNPEGIWLCRGTTFEAAPIKEIPGGFSPSAGPDQTLWIAGKVGADIVVRQHAFDGELLREMKIAEDFAETAQIFASKDSLSFYLLLRSQNWSRQTLRGYRPAAPATPTAEGAAQADWEVFLDKTIENSRRFGFVDGKLVANAGDAPQKTEEKISLPPSTLTSKTSDMVLKASSDKSGLWLTAADGLPIFCVSGRTSAQRIVLATEAKGKSVRVYAGDGVVVAEYLVSGLDSIAGIEAGEIEIP